MSAEILRATASELGERIARRELTAVEVTTAFLDQIERVDDDVKAFLHVDRAWSLDQARVVDARLDAGEKLGPLAGVPIAVKDIFCTQGVPTTCGSKILEGWLPPYNATVIDRVRNAGLVMIGKANMDEFAMGSSTENSAYQVTGNPWDLERVPGGSGGGSSAGVLPPYRADTGGSIRQPRGRDRNSRRRPPTAARRGRGHRHGVLAGPAGPVRPHRPGRRPAARDLRHDPMDSTSIDAPCPPW